MKLLSATNLPNRLELERALDEALVRSARYERQGAVVFVDIDGMKNVNDGRGHRTGDRFLKEVASRIRSVTRNVDTPSRLRGDEFVVLLAELDEPKGAETYACKLLSLLSRPWQAGDWSLLSASIGIARFPEAGTTADDLMHAADAAMYEAKRAGGHRIFVSEGRGLREVH